jgi:hypothetical protein
MAMMAMTTRSSMRVNPQGDSQGTETVPELAGEDARATLPGFQQHRSQIVPQVGDARTTSQMQM